MTKDKALERLKTLLVELQGLPNYVYNAENKEFTKWERKAWRYIEDIFKDSERGQMSSFQGIDFEYYPSAYFGDGPSPSEYIQVHNKARKEAETLIESFIEEVEERDDDEIINDNPEIVKFRLLINEAESLKTSKFKRYEVNPEFDKWLRRVERSIDKVCGENSKISSEISSINFKYTGPRGMDGVEVPLDKTTYQNGLVAVISLIESVIEELDEGTYDETIQRDSVVVHSPEITKIFISHASKDAEIVGDIIELLETIGAEEQQIFCTSFEGYGIDLGANFLDTIKDELSSEILVIFVLSENFYASPVCLCEMGAAWILSKEHIPVLIPPLDYKDVQGVIPLTQGLKINEPLKLNQLKEKIEKIFNVEKNLSVTNWERKRDKIVARIEKAISG